MDTLAAHSAAHTETGGRSCPFQAQESTDISLSPADQLSFAKHKRLSSALVRSAAGQPEFHIYYGNKEVIFDEPELFPFAQALVQRRCFAAGEAVSWGPGYSWRGICKLLSALVVEEVLVRATTEGREPERSEGAVPALLPRSGNLTARSWTECAELTRELGGREVELGYLELLVPVYRVAHATLDADGRQVGEANVFPPSLRLDVVTEWRICQYPGSRFQDPCPMNVSALKAMTRHWRPLMLLVARLRDEYLERYPEAAAAMNLGHVEQLCSLILGYPTYFLQRQRGRVENGELHPLLSSMFRVTDGLRLSAQALLTTPSDELTLPLSPYAKRSSTEIYEYTERTLGFMSAFGVCAGPRHLVEEFLALVIEGKERPGLRETPLGADVEAFLASQRAAFDYGLLGLESYAISSSLWGLIAKTYVELETALAAIAEPASALLEELRAVVAARVAHLKQQTMLARPDLRQVYEERYAHMYHQAEHGLGVANPRALPTLLAPCLHPADATLRAQLEALLTRRWQGTLAAPAPSLRMLGAILFDYFKREQAIVRAGGFTQQRVNALLGRSQPVRALCGADLAIHNHFLPTNPPFPYLEQDLREVLQVAVTVTAANIEIRDLLA